MKKIVLAVAIMLVLGSLNLAHAEIPMFGYTFDDNAFSDNATYVSGNIIYYGFSTIGYTETGDPNKDLPMALNGHNLNTCIEGAMVGGGESPYLIDVEFVDNYLYNGPGADLAIWERYGAEAMYVSLFNPLVNDWTSEKYYMPVHVGDLPPDETGMTGVNVAEVDFSYWGLPSDVQINKIRVNGYIYDNNGAHASNVAVFGGLNSKSVVPEPATLSLLGLGLVGVLIRRKT
jgi:hypothetical protein